MQIVVPFINWYRLNRSYLFEILILDNGEVQERSPDENYEGGRVYPPRRRLGVDDCARRGIF